MCMRFAMSLFLAMVLVGCSSEDDSQVAIAKTPPGMEGVDALIYATKGGDLEVVKRFVVEDPDLLSAQDFHGNTLLHIAASYNRLEMVSYLLAEGADPTAENYDGQTPYELADSELADVEILDLLDS